MNVLSSIEEESVDRLAYFPKHYQREIRMTAKRARKQAEKKSTASNWKYHLGVFLTAESEEHAAVATHSLLSRRKFSLTR